MTQPTTTAIRCAQCGQPVGAQVRTVIDAQRDPQGKSLLIAGDLNQFRCTNCGFVNVVKTPLLYHDAQHQLLVALVPMEVSAQMQQNDEKIIGDLMNQLTAMLPKNEFKSYMFNPKRALTEQGLVDQILEADGITREMLDAQKARVNLLQTLLETPPDQLEAVIKQNDAQIDGALFQTLTAMAQRTLQQGQNQIAGALMRLQEDLLQHSTFGQQIEQQQAQQAAIVEEVAGRLQQIGQSATRSTFADMAVEYADDALRLQALVGLARPAFDYDFFQEFSVRISQAPAAERDKLETLRDTLLELTQAVDGQTQASVQQAAQFLQAVVNSPDPQAMIQDNLQQIDDTFMGVLSANIQEMERRGDAQTADAFKHIYNLVVEALRSQMSPELRFINELLGTEDDDQLRQALAAQVGNYRVADLLQLLDSVERILFEQQQAALLPRAHLIRTELEARQAAQ